MKKLTDQEVESLLETIQECSGSDAICRELQARLKGILPELDVFVDVWPDVRTVVARVDSTSEWQDFLKYNVYVFTTSDNEKSLSEILNKPEVIDWKRRNEFIGANSWTMSIIVKVSRTHGCVISTMSTYYRMRTSLDTLQVRAIPDGYHLRLLQPEEAHMVSSTWFERNECSEAYIRFLIENFPSLCLYNDEGDIVGFVMNKHNGTSGMLFVFDQFRHEGFEEVIVSNFSNQLLENGSSEVVVGLRAKNVDSMQVYENVGFEHAQAPVLYRLSLCHIYQDSTIVVDKLYRNPILDQINPKHTREPVSEDQSETDGNVKEEDVNDLVNDVSHDLESNADSYSPDADVIVVQSETGESCVCNELNDGTVRL